MERLLHYVWKHRLYNPVLHLVDSGDVVEVIGAGQSNSNAGPDFFNAKVRIGDVVWAGNVELHIDEGDWYVHGHDKDAAYNNTILHVVERLGSERAMTADGKRIPTVVLAIPESVQTNYDTLLRSDDYPRCHSILPQIESIKVHSWLESLLVERMQERAGLVRQRAERNGGDWERAFFITLARNFGFGKNGDEFEQWAQRLPLHQVVHHRDNLFQVQAMFLGVAGLIDRCMEANQGASTMDWKSEYRYLSAKFNISADMPTIQWRYLRMRPMTFPHVRVMQLAYLYHTGAISLSTIVENDTVAKLERLLDCGLSHASRHLIIINTVAPVLWAYADHQHRPELKDQAIRLLESLPSEANYITRQWQACGIRVDTAAYSQALIQLKRTRCDVHDCLRCRFAYQFLRQAPYSV